MPRGRPPRPPSLRNLQLCHEVIYLHCPQDEVAARFHVSQPRVAAICRQVSAWVDALIPRNVLSQGIAAFASHQPVSDSEAIAALLTSDAACRLHLALAMYRVHLTRAYEKYLDCFGGHKHAADLAPLVAAWKEGSLSTEISALLPRLELIESAVQMAQELDGLAHLAHRGPFFDLSEQVSRAKQQQSPLVAPAPVATPAFS